MEKLTNLRDAMLYYANPTRCLVQMIKTRFPNGTACLRCGVVNPTSLKTAQRFKCNSCKAQFSLKVGTIFEHSPIPLTKWFPAIWMLTGAKNGISSYELGRALGVSQKTAWFMLHRIREAISEGSLDMFSGPVEADETVIGGLEKFKHAHKKKRKGSGGDHKAGKSVVMGILNRGDGSQKSKIRASLIYDTTTDTLRRKIGEVVEDHATLYTDALSSYRALSDRYLHEYVDHTKLYVQGQIHTNGVENFWALLKRCLKGTYIAVQPFHLKRYIDEMVYRFNNRDGDDGDRFQRALRLTIGKRLTFEELTRSYEAYYDIVLPKVT